MKNVKFTLLSVGLVLAMAFTFSCSSPDDDGGGGGATYWYSVYGIKDASSNTYISDLFNQYRNNPSYDDIKYVWSEIKRIGTWIESDNGMSEQELKEFLIRSDMSPKDADGMLTRLKEKGNGILQFDSASPLYYSIILYLERE